MRSEELTTERGAMKPSGGVIAIGVLSIVLGVIGLILIPFQILGTLVGKSFTGASYLDFGILRAPIDLVLEIILITSGIGVFMLKRWARTLALIYAWATIILGIIGLITVVPQIAKISADAHPSFKAGMMGGLVGGGIALAYPITLLIFFSRRGVKEQFLKRPGGQGDIETTKVEEADQIKSILQKGSTPRFKNREEYEKWKADRLHAANSDK